MWKKAIIAIFICMSMTVLPIATTVGDEEPSGDGIYMGEMWGYEPGHFNYSDDGVIGNYLRFEINESTGIVTDYTVTLSTFDMFYPMLMYEEELYDDETKEKAISPEFPGYNITYENVTIFESIEVTNFTPNGLPGTFVDMFVFQGENSLMMFYDRDWNQGYYAAGDMDITIIFEVAEGLEISEFPYYWDDDWYYEEEWEEEGEETGGEGGEEEDPEYPDDDLYWDSQWAEIWIESENTTTSIFVNLGNATIENNTITVNLSPNGYLDINTWAYIDYYPIFDDIWYNDMEYEEEFALIEMAKEEGLIAAEGWYFEGGDEYGYPQGDMQRGMENYDYYSYDDPTFNMEFVEYDDGLDITVESYIPEGRIVMLNLNDEAIEAHSIDDLLVKLDDEKIEATETLEELMEEVDGTEAKYFALFSDSGTTVFVYVPHFSVHTITIESLFTTSLDILVPTLLAVVFVAITALVVVLKGRKGKDEF